MTQYFPIRQLGEKGINTDTPPYELAINEFSAGRNVRFANGSAQTMPAPLAIDTLAEAPVWGQAWLRDGSAQLAYASATRLYVRENEAFVDRSDLTTYPGGYSSSTGWQSHAWGETPVFNNGIEVPQVLEPTDTTFKDMPAWPSDLRAKSVKGYKNFMVAIGITEGGVDYPNTVRWSTEAEPGQLPWTWDVSDLAGLAGANPVDSGAGELVDQLPLAGSNILYSNDSAYLMQFVGGQFVFNFEKIFDKGILCRDAVAAFENFHFVVGPAELYVHDGNTPRPIAHRRTNRTFYRELGNRDSVRCVANAKSKEIWVFYSTGSGTAANRALVFNWLDNSFTFVSVPNVQCPLFGPRQGDIITWGELGPFTWADLTQAWGEFADDDYYPVMYYFSSDGTTHELYEADFLNTTVDTQAVYLERTGIDLDQMLRKPAMQTCLIQKVVPQISGSGVVRITVGGSDTPMGAVEWSDPVLFNVDTDVDVDVRVNARYLAIKVESVDTGFWRLTGWDFDLKLAGMR